MLHLAIATAIALAMAFFLHLNRWDDQDMAINTHIADIRMLNVVRQQFLASPSSVSMVNRGFKFVR